MSDPDEPEFAYLTTSGRITGRAHRVELWFVTDAETVFFLAGYGDRSDWVRNLMISPDVILEMMTSGGRRTLRLGPSYRVSGTVSLRAELEHILGPAALPAEVAEPAPAAA